MIKDLIESKDHIGYYLVRDASKRVKKSGEFYLNITLQDASGTINAKKWDLRDNDTEIIKQGNIIKVIGSVLLYNGKLQVVINQVQLVDPKDVNMADFSIETPTPQLNSLESKLDYYLKSIKNEDCRKILNEIFSNKYKDLFLEYPAAVKNHHEYKHGLLEHTISMCEVAEFCALHYSDVNYDLLISGCLLHDIGKLIELSPGLVTKYTVEGNLLGHLTIGMSLIKEIADKLNINSEVPLLLEHMILSHHGKLEYGAAVLPSTREALLLSMIDDMDAKMKILDKAYENVGEGEYTEKIFALDNRAFYKSKLK